MARGARGSVVKRVAGSGQVFGLRQGERGGTGDAGVHRCAGGERGPITGPQPGVAGALPAAAASAAGQAAATWRRRAPRMGCEVCASRRWCASGVPAGGAPLFRRVAQKLMAPAPRQRCAPEGAGEGYRTRGCRRTRRRCAAPGRGGLRGALPRRAGRCGYTGPRSAGGAKPRSVRPAAPSALGEEWLHGGAAGRGCAWCCRATGRQSSGGPPDRLVCGVRGYEAGPGWGSLAAGGLEGGPRRVAAKGHGAGRRGACCGGHAGRGADAADSLRAH